MRNGDANPINCTKFALTDCAVFMVTTQEPLPEHAPDHESKPKPLFGTGVKVTDVP